MLEEEKIPQRSGDADPACRTAAIRPAKRVAEEEAPGKPTRHKMVEGFVLFVIHEKPGQQAGCRRDLYLRFGLTGNAYRTAPPEAVP